MRIGQKVLAIFQNKNKKSLIGPQIHLYSRKIGRRKTKMMKKAKV